MNKDEILKEINDELREEFDKLNEKEVMQNLDSDIDDKLAYSYEEDLLFLDNTDEELTQEASETTENSKTKKTFINIAIIVFAILFILSVYWIVSYKYGLYKDREQFALLEAETELLISNDIRVGYDDNIVSEIIEKNMNDFITKINNMNKHNKVDQIQQLKAKKWFKSLKNQNPDFAFWLTINSAYISYPVMYNSIDENYYLRRRFDKDYSLSGTPFLDIKTPLQSFDTDTPNLNIVYGHNMRDGTMFSNIVDYEDIDVLKNSSEIIMTLGEDTYRYKIFCFTKLKAYTILSDDIYGHKKFEDKDDYKHYINLLINSKNAVYLEDAIPEYPSDILLLSTCSSHVSNGRSILVAYREKE